MWHGRCVSIFLFYDMDCLSTPAADSQTGHGGGGGLLSGGTWSLLLGGKRVTFLQAARLRQGLTLFCLPAFVQGAPLGQPLTHKRTYAACFCSALINGFNSRLHIKDQPYCSLSLVLDSRVYLKCLWLIVSVIKLKQRDQGARFRATLC